MRKNQRSLNMQTTMGLISALALGSVVLASGQDADRASDPQVVSRTPVVQVPVSTPRAGDEGSIAGVSPIVFDNGPVDTGQAGCAGTLSLLENTTLGLNILGAGAQSISTINNRIADDFTLAACTNLDTITFQMYQTGATTATITGMNVTLHSAQPANPSDAVLQTATGGTVVLSNTFRTAEGVPGCTRRIQTITVDVSSWPDLTAGSYWLSWQAAGTLASGPWQPQVTIIGLCGKVGANGLQSQTGGAFLALLDTGGGAGCEGAPQDSPFVIRGDACGGGPTCTGNIVTTGSSATAVDVDDLLAVITAWGPCPAPPTTCPANIATAGSSATSVDVDDLLLVITSWGPCPS